MNLREGTRRLALLLGVAGAIVGGFASYMELQPMLAQRTAHKQFEQLANSGIVQQQRKVLQSTPDFIPDMSAASGAALGQDGKKPRHKPMGKYTLADIAPALPAGATDATVVQQPTRTPKKHSPDKWAKYRVPSPPAQTDPYAAIAAPIPSVVMEGGIKTINWSNDYAVQSIETQDGQTLYPTPSPSRWSYFLTFILPVLGFLIPWGAIRAIGWVGAGFVQTVSHT